MIKKIKKLKLPGRRKSEAFDVSQRITNETVAEHREKILAGGRKFKYPVQYARHRLIFNAIAVSVVAILVFVAVVWWQLYPAQNTGPFFYRVTQIAPLPIASVDGQSALYKNYLMEYRSSIYWLQQKSRGYSANTTDGVRQSDHIKRQSLDSAIETAYAEKIAQSRDVNVSESDVDMFIAQALRASDRTLSQQAYESVLSDSYGVSPAEYRTIVRSELLKQKVSFTIDTTARQRVENAQSELKKGADFASVVTKYSDDTFAKTTKGDMGFVPKTNRDQGFVEQVLKLNKDQISGIVKGNDGYYILKLTDSNDTQVRYSRIKIGLTTFDKNLSNLKKQGKVKEYISVPLDK